jgi:hypothetical protein
MKMLRTFLNATGMCLIFIFYTNNNPPGMPEAQTESSFISYMNSVWFTPYSRGSRDSSSGFEHIFVYDNDQDEIKGLHSWLRLYKLEKDGRVDYAGYSQKRHVCLCLLLLFISIYSHLRT